MVVIYFSRNFELPQLVGTVDGNDLFFLQNFGLPQLVGTVEGVIGRSVDVA